MSLAQSWRLTREILRDHTSNSFAALAGWSYTPTGAEIALWDQMELEGRLKRKGYRPWTDHRTNWLDPPQTGDRQGTPGTPGTPPQTPGHLPHRPLAPTAIGAQP